MLRFVLAGTRSLIADSLVISLQRILGFHAEPELHEKSMSKTGFFFLFGRITNTILDYHVDPKCPKLKILFSFRIWSIKGNSTSNFEFSLLVFRLQTCLISLICFRDSRMVFFFYIQSGSNQSFSVCKLLGRCQKSRFICLHCCDIASIDGLRRDNHGSRTCCI